MAGAAIRPAWRMPPPSILAARRAFCMKSRSPARIAPTGPPRPLQSANHTESTCSAERGDRHVEAGGGIEQPGAVEMHGQCRRWRATSWMAAMVLDRRHGSAGGVVGVLQADEPRRRQREVRGPLDGAPRRPATIEDAAVALDRARDRAGHGRQTAALGVVDMGRLLDDDLAAAAVVGDHGGEVGHRAGRHEQRVVLAGHLAGQALQLVDRRDRRRARRRPAAPRRSPAIIAGVGRVTVSLRKSWCHGRRC